VDDTCEFTSEKEIWSLQVSDLGKNEEAFAGKVEARPIVSRSVRCRGAYSDCGYGNERNNR
jgi:hypothetical protein